MPLHIERGAPMSVRRLTRNALLTAIALTIFLVELQIPAPVPVPGVKPGLANIVTVYAMFVLGPGDAAAILLSRIVLGSIFSGRVMAMFYSLAGGVFSYLALLGLRRVLTTRQIPAASVLSAAAHNVGQIAMAIFITGTPRMLLYLPVLLLSGTLAGLFTGLCARFLTDRLPASLRTQVPSPRP